VVGSVSYSTQSTLFSSPTSDHSSAQKSQPRNGEREIFTPAVGETTRDNVSIVNWMVCDAQKSPQNRGKPDSSKRQKLLQYQ
jgi:hypothetical protein